MNQQQIDEIFMHRCLQLAVNGHSLSRPNPMVGAVITVPSSVQNDEHELEKGVCGADGNLPRIIGEGYHVCCGKGHAEVNAFASVRPEDAHLLPSATIYVSLEPCAHYGKTPPCCDLIVSKGVRRVVVGCVDPFAKVQGRGIQRIREAGIDVTVGVLEAECQWLNRRFFTFHQLGRPYIILKWAQTADGFLDDHGHAVSVSTPYTKMLVHQLRAEEDAILVGRVTDEREHPRLDVREWHGSSPVRFVLSHAHPLSEVFEACRQRQLQSLVVEGGAATLRFFLDQGLWDELRIERSSVLVGDGTPAPFLPKDIRLLAAHQYGSNRVEKYVKR